MIILSPMAQVSFDHYLAKLKDEFAVELMRTGEFTEEEAGRKSEQTMAELLPQGLATKDHYLFDIKKKGRLESVGILYLAIKEENGTRHAFVYDIEINKGLRGKGFGTQVMQAAEKIAGKKGARDIGLHVFASNTGAYHLYQKLGYQVRKVLEGKDGSVIGRRMSKTINAEKN
jgi:ribosomal protein S18 acetylase RimI-like enzyme